MFSVEAAVAEKFEPPVCIFLEGEAMQPTAFIAMSDLTFTNSIANKLTLRVINLIPIVYNYVILLNVNID